VLTSARAYVALHRTGAAGRGRLASRAATARKGRRWCGTGSPGVEGGASAVQGRRAVRGRRTVGAADVEGDRPKRVPRCVSASKGAPGAVGRRRGRGGRGSKKRRRSRAHARPGDVEAATGEWNAHRGSACKGALGVEVWRRSSSGGPLAAAAVAGRRRRRRRDRGSEIERANVEIDLSAGLYRCGRLVPGRGCARY